MTGYALAHAIMAGVCAFVGVFYLVTWRLSRGDRAVAWVGVCFLGFAMMDLSIAGSSVAGERALGDPRPWLVLVAVAITFLPVAVLQTAWQVIDLEVTRRRWLMAALFTALCVARGIEIAATTATASGERSFEQVASATDSPIAVAVWAVCFAICAISTRDGIRMLRRSPGLALSVIIVAAPVMVVFAREVALGRGWLEGPTLAGVAGLWFMVFAAVVTGVRQAQAHAARPDEGGDLSRYRILRRIAGGGMGETFLATRSGPAGFSRHVALKRIHIDAAADPHAIERFLAEARIAAQLRHSNIVAVHDLGRTDDGWFLVMEYVAGVTVAQIIQRCAALERPAPPAIAAGIGVGVCRGLAFAHDRGVIHRDISPDNLMVAFTGDVKIVDFGIARAAPVDLQVASEPAGAGARGGRFTRADGVVGKLPYAAPERLAGAPAAPRSDLFSLGVVLYELLAGRRPFAGPTHEDEARQILTESYLPLRRLRPDVPAALEAVVDRALARRAGGRPDSAAAMAGALSAVLDQIGRADPADWTQQMFPAEWEAEVRLDSIGEASASAAAPTPTPTPGPTRTAPGRPPR